MTSRSPVFTLAAGSIEREMARLAASPRSLLLERRAHQVLLAYGSEAPNALRAIGALRAETFREMGEGTDAELDLDEYDPYYMHLIIWNREAQEIVGAYRMAVTREGGLTECGRPIYTSTLFRYGAGFFARRAPALELGRAFVQPKYQRAVEPLFLLWQGIGKVLARRPEIRHLFGAVSISKLYSERSRRLMLSYLRRARARAETERRSASWPRARRPATPRLGALPADVSDLRSLESRVRELEGGTRGVPVLIHRYLELGGAFLAYHDDALFNSIACLIVVDVERIESRALDRFMGREEAENYRRSRALSAS